MVSSLETELSDAGGRDRPQAGFTPDSRRDSAQAGGRGCFRTRPQSHSSSLCDWGRVEHDALTLTEHVRVGLKKRICYQISQGRPLLFVYRLDPEFEEMFRNSIRQSAVGAYLAMDPEMSQQVMEAARAQIGNLPPGAQKPVIVTDSEIRRFVKKLIDFVVPEVTVLSYDQLTPQINLQPLGTIAPVVRPQIAITGDSGS